MFPTAAAVQQSVNGTVLWSELTRHLSTALYTSPAEWCVECGNTAADVCLAAAAAASAAKDTASTATATGTASSGGSSSKTAVAAIFALFAGLVGGTVLGRVWSKRRMKRNGTGLIKQPYFSGGVAADEPHAPTRTGGTVSWCNGVTENAVLAIRELSCLVLLVYTSIYLLSCSTVAKSVEEVTGAAHALVAAVSRTHGKHLIVYKV
eukprot:15202-Heterococcus_DN1.PRE.6